VRAHCSPLFRRHFLFPRPLFYFTTCFSPGFLILPHQVWLSPLYPLFRCGENFHLLIWSFIYFVILYVWERRETEDGSAERCWRFCSILFCFAVKFPFLVIFFQALFWPNWRFLPSVSISVIPILAPLALSSIH